MSNYATAPAAGLDLLATAVMCTDGAGRITYLNPAAENLFAASLKRLRGRLLGSAFGGTAPLQRALREAQARHAPCTVRNVELRCADGRLRQLSCNLAPLEGEGGVFIEIWPIDEALKANRDERRREGQKISHDFIRNLAHEIRNPLGGIRGAAQLLQEELAALCGSALSEYTEVIVNEVDRLHNLLQRLLMPQRPQREEAVNIHEVLERVRRLIAAEFPRRISFHRDYDVSLPSLAADHEQLIQAFLNLMRNAAQAMRGSGAITLQTRLVRQVRMAGRLHRLALEVRVIDDGPGVPPEIVERMFQPLVTGRADGFGLGLPIAQNIVIAHGGTLDCETRPGRTELIIRLPFPAAAAALPERAA